MDHVFFLSWTCRASIIHPSVDGRNPKQPPGMPKNSVNNGINYQSQPVSRISEPSTVSRWIFDAVWHQKSFRCLVAVLDLLVQQQWTTRKALGEEWEGSLSGD